MRPLLPLLVIAACHAARRGDASSDDTPNPSDRDAGRDTAPTSDVTDDTDPSAVDEDTAAEPMIDRVRRILAAEAWCVAYSRRLRAPMIDEVLTWLDLVGGESASLTVQLPPTAALDGPSNLLADGPELVWLTTMDVTRYDPLAMRGERRPNGRRTVDGVPYGAPIGRLGGDLVQLRRLGRPADQPALERFADFDALVAGGPFLSAIPLPIDLIGSTPFIGDADFLSTAGSGGPILRFDPVGGTYVGEVHAQGRGGGLIEGLSRAGDRIFVLDGIGGVMWPTQRVWMYPAEGGAPVGHADLPLTGFQHGPLLCGTNP